MQILQDLLEDSSLTQSTYLKESRFSQVQQKHTLLHPCAHLCFKEIEKIHIHQPLLIQCIINNSNIFVVTNIGTCLLYSGLH